MGTLINACPTEAVVNHVGTGDRRDRTALVKVNVRKLARMSRGVINDLSAYRVVNR